MIEKTPALLRVLYFIIREIINKNRFFRPQEILAPYYISTLFCDLCSMFYQNVFYNSILFLSSLRREKVNGFVIKTTQLGHLHELSSLVRYLDYLARAIKMGRLARVAQLGLSRKVCLARMTQLAQNRPQAFDRSQLSLKIPTWEKDLNQKIASCQNITNKYQKYIHVSYKYAWHRIAVSRQNPRWTRISK